VPYGVGVTPCTTHVELVGCSFVFKNI